MYVRGLCFATLSALCFTLMGVVVHDLKGDFNAYELTQFRTIWLVLLLLPFAFREFLGSFRLSSYAVWLRALLGGIGLILNYTSLQLLPISTASLLIAGLTTIIVTLGEWLIFRNQMGQRKVIGVLIVFLGLVTYYHEATFEMDRYLYLYPLFGAIFSAGAFLSLKKATNAASTSGILFILSLVTLLIASCFSFDLNKISSSFYSYNIRVLVALSFLTQVFLVLSYRHIQPSDATVASQTAVFWCLLIDVFWNGKPIYYVDIVATLAIFCGIYLIAKVQRIDSHTCEPPQT